MSVYRCKRAGHQNEWLHIVINLPVILYHLIADESSAKDFILFAIPTVPSSTEVETPIAISINDFQIISSNGQREAFLFSPL